MTQLIKFLEGEVQNELRISMVVKGFDLMANNVDSEKKRRSKTRAKNEDVPTAVGLLTTKEKDSVYSAIPNTKVRVVKMPEK